MSKISFIRSDNRRYNIERCLSLIKSEVIALLKDAKKVAIKINCISPNIQLAVTHAETLDALLSFISPYVKNQIVLAGNTTGGETIEAFKNYNHLELQGKYDLVISDLNTDEATGSLDKENVENLKTAKTIAEADCLITLCPPKTDGDVIYSGAIKNIFDGGFCAQKTTEKTNFLNKIFGLGSKDQRIKTVEEIAQIHRDIVAITQRCPSSLAIIDGFETMQGNGPIEGEMSPTHFAIASTNPLAADWLACRVLDIDPNGVKYLSLLKPEHETDHFVVGDDWLRNIAKIKMHRNFEKIRQTE